MAQTVRNSGRSDNGVWLSSRDTPCRAGVSPCGPTSAITHKRVRPRVVCFERISDVFERKHVEFGAGRNKLREPDWGRPIRTENSVVLLSAKVRPSHAFLRSVT